MVPSIFQYRGKFPPLGECCGLLPVNDLSCSTAELNLCTTTLFVPKSGAINNLLQAEDVPLLLLPPLCTAVLERCNQLGVGCKELSPIDVANAAKLPPL